MKDNGFRRAGNAAELCAIVRDAARDGRKLAITGGGTKAEIGGPEPRVDRLSMDAFSGIIDYDPAELVITAGAATPLDEIEAAIEAEGQMLAFDPPDMGPVFGGAAGRSTIGGVVASGFSGSQRLTRGAVRDHLLGFAAVSGRSELFKAGAKVVKNVTGYDLPKLMCGSWGRLAALTEVTLKVSPRSTCRVTMTCEGLTPVEAWSAMATLLCSQAEIAAAAFAPPGVLREHSVTAIRLQGFEPSVAARSSMVEAMTRGRPFCRIGASEGRSIWTALRDLSPLSVAGCLWRISLPPREAPGFIAALASADSHWMMDWAGGLIWLVSEQPSAVIRAAATQRFGHAMLMRADSETRATVPALHPQPPALAALEERVRRAFDPLGVFETGRF